MKTQVSKGPFPFYIPKSKKRSKRFSKILALKNLASENGLNATDIVKKAQDETNKNPIWKEMLEAVGIDCVDVELADAELADHQIRNGIHELQQRLLERNRQLGLGDDDIEEPEEDLPQASPSTRKKLFDFPVTSVLRYLGKEEWDFLEVKNVMRELDVDPADATIRAQLRAGVLGTRGEPAKLTENQKETLENIRRNIEKPATTER